MILSTSIKKMFAFRFLYFLCPSVCLGQLVYVLVRLFTINLKFLETYNN